MRAQVSVFMLLGVLMLVGLLTVLAYVALIVTGTIADPFVAADVTSYFNSCFEQALQCSLYEKGLSLELKELSVLEREAQEVALSQFPVCVQNISRVFKGQNIALQNGEQKASLFFADMDTKLTLDSPAVVTIGKATKKISGLVAEKPVAFARMLETARSLNPGVDKIAPDDHVIEDLDDRYRVQFFEAAGGDVVVLRDTRSNITFRNPYTVVFRESAGTTQ
ncbi:hypothetical protein HY490_02595 [Candidatus Woesearchaeota archaeon]|nr:hypothetical protein [Candidatus Woesearchaeota archaeon]